MVTEATAKKKGPVLKVMGLDGTEGKEMTLPQEMFGSEVSDATLTNYIRIYLNNQRKGTASAKTRGEVIGTTKKVYRQKGTGGARHGSRKAPIFVGGGVTFGPQPREFLLKMNKKQKRIALFTSLTMKTVDKELIGLSDDALKIEAKTKNFTQFLKKNGLEEKKVLLVTPAPERGSLHLATRNVKNVSVIDSANLNAYTVLTNDMLVFVESAVDSLQKHYAK